MWLLAFLTAVVAALLALLFGLGRGLVVGGAEGQSQSLKKRFEHYKATRPIVRRELIPDGAPRAKRIAMIVPYRDQPLQNRARQLRDYIALFSKQPVDIFVSEQGPGARFNRARLLNIGYLVAKEMGPYDSYIFNDVDMLPSEDLLPYYFVRPDPVIHLTAPRVFDHYRDKPAFFGGAVAFTGEAFERINGFPHNFFGWGGDDDVLHDRVAAAGMRVWDPPRGEVREERHLLSQAIPGHKNPLYWDGRLDAYSGRNKSGLTNLLAAWPSPAATVTGAPPLVRILTEISASEHEERPADTPPKKIRGRRKK